MKFDDLTEDNFLLFAMEHYDNPHCSGMDEFRSDLHHIKYLKRLFKRYKDTKSLESLRPRLVLNHLIVFYNVFKPEAATRILFLKIEKDFWPFLKTFLAFLGKMPLDRIEGIKGKKINVPDIPMDNIIANELRKI